MSVERRFCELRAEGARLLSGTAIRYGDVARFPWGTERIEAGAFGDVAALDVILNNGHERTRPVARSGGGGLILLDGLQRLEVKAELPEVAEADEVLKLVRAKIYRGFSIEFVAQSERIEDDMRVIEQADLTGLAVVDRPAYTDSQVAARWRAVVAHGKAGGLPGTPAQRREADRRRAWL